MILHTVAPGETLTSIGREYGLAPGLIARYNGLPPPYTLAVGQSLLLLFPSVLHMVREGETLWQIARQYDTDPLLLLRCNPNLSGVPRLYPGQVLVISFTDEPSRSAQCLGYAYPFARESVLRGILPYDTWFSPFTFGITAEGGLIDLSVKNLLTIAGQYGNAALLHLSTLTETGGFSSDRAAQVLGSAGLQERLINEVARRVQEGGYAGADVDFEFLPAPYADAYAEFLATLRDRLHEQGCVLFAALAPKTSTGQKGLLYEGHSYAKIGASVDAVLLMTYEWGYTFGPAGSVAPLDQVRRVLSYALTEIPADKIFLGFPNYAYDWTLPFRAGESRARSISNPEAAELAARYGAEIRFDERSATPHFNYTLFGAVHEVWFEDPRSAQAKFALLGEFGLRGVGFWNFMRPFPAGFSLLNAMYVLTPGTDAASALLP